MPILAVGVPVFQQYCQVCLSTFCICTSCRSGPYKSDAVVNVCSGYDFTVVKVTRNNDNWPARSRCPCPRAHSVVPTQPQASQHWGVVMVNMGDWGLESGDSRQPDRGIDEVSSVSWWACPPASVECGQGIRRGQSRYLPGEVNCSDVWRGPCPASAVQDQRPAVGWRTPGIMLGASYEVVGMVEWEDSRQARGWAGTWARASGRQAYQVIQWLAVHPVSGAGRKGRELPLVIESALSNGGTSMSRVVPESGDMDIQKRVNTESSFSWDLSVRGRNEMEREHCWYSGRVSYFIYRLIRLGSVLGPYIITRHLGYTLRIDLSLFN